MRNTTIPIGFAALAGLSMPAAAQEQDGAPKDWQGRYRYEHAAGRTAGGTSVVVTYDLMLRPPDLRDGCVLTIRGFQSDETLRCRTRRDGPDLAVTFDRYGDGGTVNTYGVAIHKPGRTLFTLAKGEGSRLVTRWQGLAPDGEGTAASGPYFAKVYSAKVK